VARVSEAVPADGHDPLRQLADAVADDVRAVVGAALHDELRISQLAHVSINAHAPLLDHQSRHSVHARVLALLSGFGALATYLSDPSVTEVAVNAGNQVWVDRNGRMQRVGTIEPDELHGLVERILAPLGLRFDRTAPVVDARLPNGQRLCAVLEPLAVDGTCVSIRQFSLQPIGIGEFAPPEVCALVAELVRSRANIVVSGATSSGKTTLLNALGALVPDGDRIITIEDTAELRLDTPHVVRLEARPATPDGVAAVTVRDLLRAALRLRPDRLVVGEVRGAEAYDMVQALNTGHDGSLSTVHANRPDDAVRRVVTLAALGAPGQDTSLVEEQVRSSIDVVVHVERTPDGRRRIAHIDEVARHPSPHSTIPLATATAVVGEFSRCRTPGQHS